MRDEVPKEYGVIIFDTYSTRRYIGIMLEYCIIWKVRVRRNLMLPRVDRGHFGSTMGS